MPKRKPSGQRKHYGLSLDPQIMQEIQHLAIDQDRYVNDLIEEGMLELLKKHRGKKGETGHHS
ncbi:MAG: hypothetical protein ABW047_15520 [Nitrospiraceae bacterium]